MLNFNIGAKGAEPVRGEQAAALQLLLNDRGAKLAVDGVAGDVTRSALIAFQSAKGIGPPENGTGDIGAYTYAALFKPLAGGAHDHPHDHPVPDHSHTVSGSAR